MLKIDNKVIILLLALFLGFRHKESIKIPLSIPGSVAIVETKDRQSTEPTQAIKSSLQPIIDIIKGSKTQRNKQRDAFALGDFYGDFSKILVSQTLIKNTSDLRESLILAGKMHFPTVGFTPNDYPGLAEAIDKYISANLGLEVVTLDATKTQSVLLGLQWAFYEASK